MSAPKQYPRAERVRAAIRQVLAEEAERLRDDIGFITITEVTLTPDLRHAVAYYTILEDGDGHDRVRDAVTAATKRFRTAVAKSIRLKYAPELTFEEDPVPGQGDRIDELIRKLHEGDA